MTDLEREAREAAEVYRVACGLGTVGSGQLTHEAIGYAQGFYDAAAPREQEIERLRARVAELEGMAPKWVRTMDVERRHALALSGWRFAVEVVQQETSTLWMLYVPSSVAKPPIPLPEPKA